VAIPPWHLWGNSETFKVPVQNPALPLQQAVSGQLCKISYGRPETWHWLFAAKLIDGPNSPGFQTQLEVSFDLTVGLGRSAVLLRSLQSPVQDKSFESYFFQWGPLAANFPRGAQLYSTQVLAPNRQYRSDPPFPDQTGNPTAASDAVAPAYATAFFPPLIEQIVAESIQLQCHMIAVSAPGSPSLGQLVTVEVQALFAPKTHVRPDWFQIGAPPHTQFPGKEVPAR
jgi:hypothetical protein